MLTLTSEELQDCPEDLLERLTTVKFFEGLVRSIQKERDHRRAHERPTEGLWIHSRRDPKDEAEAMARDFHLWMLETVFRKGLEFGSRGSLRKGRIYGMRAVLLESMASRFGPLPLKVRRRVTRISSRQRLLALARQVLIVESLDDLRL